MHYGLQAIVLALNSVEVSTDNDQSEEAKAYGAVIYLQHLREHLDAITTPVRRVCEHPNITINQSYSGLYCS